MLRAVLVILGLLLVAGALWLGSTVRLEAIASRPLLPTRFDHKFHRTVQCVTCHHNFAERGLGPGGCYACHKDWGTTELRRIDLVFHTFCTDCHRREEAAGEKAGPVKACAACHVAPSPGRLRINRG
ncbi:MAG: cytochrome c3 family protein [Geminicoccaceae bacterium]